MRFSEMNQWHFKGAGFAIPFQLKSRVRVRLSVSGRTAGALHCDYSATCPLFPTSPAPLNAYQGRTPGRCDRPEHRPISIRLEPEGITPHANVKPGAASRRIAVAKETCSGTNQDESCLSSRLCRMLLDALDALVNTHSAACSCSSRTDLGDEHRALRALTASRSAGP
jgi:hypothetical protein